VRDLSVVHTIWNAGKTRRVDVFQRADGTFGFEQWSYDIEEQSWVPFGRHSYSFMDSKETAIREARSRVRWITIDEGKSA
jgi:hypothetical protein